MTDVQFETLIYEVQQNTAAVERLETAINKLSPLLCVLLVFAFYGILRRALRKAVLRNVR